MKKAPSPLVSLLPIVVLVILLFATIRVFGSDASMAEVRYRCLLPPPFVSLSAWLSTKSLGKTTNWQSRTTWQE